MSDRTSGQMAGPLRATEFHVLMALAEGPSYGYAVMKAVADHSRGTVTPEIGSLYRILSRLMEAGWVEESSPAERARTGSRGLPRRYYALTAAGRSAANEEARRLAHVVRLARELELLAEGGSG